MTDPIARAASKHSELKTNHRIDPVRPPSPLPFRSPLSIHPGKASTSTCLPPTPAPLARTGDAQIWEKEWYIPAQSAGGRGIEMAGMPLHACLVSGEAGSRVHARQWRTEPQRTRPTGGPSDRGVGRETKERNEGRRRRRRSSQSQDMAKKDGRGVLTYRGEGKIETTEGGRE